MRKVIVKAGNLVERVARRTSAALNPRGAKLKAIQKQRQARELLTAEYEAALSGEHPRRYMNNFYKWLPGGVNFEAKVKNPRATAIRRAVRRATYKLSFDL